MPCVRGHALCAGCGHLCQIRQTRLDRREYNRVGGAEENEIWRPEPSPSTEQPVLTLWAAVVAQRLGFDEDEALTLGKAVAGLNAQAKGRRLGIFKPHEEKAKKAREKERGERFWIEVLGRPVPAMNTEDGIRAVRVRTRLTPTACGATWTTSSVRT